MAEVEAEPRLGLLGEHRLALALFFSGGRLLRDTGYFIVIGPQSLTLALPLFVFVWLDRRSYYVTQARLELTGQSTSLTCVDPPASALLLLGFHQRQHILPDDCNSFLVLGSEARFTSRTFSTASWVCENELV